MGNAPSLTHADRHGNGGTDEISIDASQVTTGTLAVARLATGTPTGSKFVRDDGTLAVPAGGGSPVGLPTYAPSGLGGTFDPIRSLYLSAPSSVSSGDPLSAVRAGLGRAIAGLGYCHILAIGDSHTDGKMDDTSNTITTPQLFAWPEAMRARLIKAGVPDGGLGWTKFGGLLQPPESRWTTSGTWGNRYGQALWSWVTSTSTGATATLTLAGGGGTTVGVMTTNNSKPFTCTIKDSGGTTISTTTITGDTTSSVRITLITSLTDAATVTLTTATGTGSNWRLGAAMIAKGSGLILSNMAISNSTATGTFGGDKDPAAGGSQYDWVMAQCVAIAGASGLAPDLSTGTLGGNDLSVGTSVSAITTAMATIYGRLGSGSKLHVANWPGSLDQSTLDAGFYTLADTLHGGFVDTYRRAGNYTTMNARGGYNSGSTIHPNQGPHAVLGGAIADALLA